jgi:hypothetical protein
MKLRCWAEDCTNVENYIVPEDSITHSQIFVEKIRFYRRDVEFHKKQVDAEIMAFWKVDGLNKDVKKLIVDKYIKRPVRYGCHINPEDVHKERKQLLHKLFFVFLSLILMCCLHYKTMEVAKVVGNELRDSYGPTEPRGFDCEYICNDNNPPTCDFDCSSEKNK